MATLTKSTGTVALSGAVEKVTLPASYGWVWLKNMSDSDIFAGLSADISEGADGVMTIPAGECGRIQTDGFGFVYLLGTGSVMVVAQNYADCPFKVGGKGGEIPDLSMYAKKTDIPTELPANGGNADTVGGKSASEFMPYIGYVDDLATVNQNCICSWNVNTLNTPFKSGKTSCSAGICIVNNIGGILPTYFVICAGAKQCFINYQNNGELAGDWKEISTTPIKSAAFSGTTGNGGDIALWLTSEKKIPMFVEIADCYAVPFLSSSDGGQYMAHAFDSNGSRSNTAVSGTVYYTEI